MTHLLLTLEAYEANDKQKNFYRIMFEIYFHKSLWKKQKIVGQEIIGLVMTYGKKHEKLIIIFCLRAK